MRLLFGLLLCSWATLGFAQSDFFTQRYQFSQADSLRGMLRPERSCYDVSYYELDLDVDVEKRYLKGRNRMHYRIKNGFNIFQIDLFANMQIDSILHRSGRSLSFFRKANAVFVDFGEMQKAGEKDYIDIYYQGKPIAAKNPPWDGGFSWAKDALGAPWVGVSCEGIGASLWWPNKDHLSDEPDSMRIRCTVPKGLRCIANGQLENQGTEEGKNVFQWNVQHPINNYNVTLNIGRYEHFSDTLQSSVSGTALPLDYYVLPESMEKARSHFKQVPQILDVFERYFGAYPFPKDGYALVETPYVGMEHQGAIAYGNRFMNGYLGAHPKGVPVDFIILHETGHEWWGNSVSCVDHGEMWLHETFTTYMEAVYVEDQYDYPTALRYMRFYGRYIQNQQPMLGPLNVNFDEHDSDMYYKGSLMLNTLRQVLQDDDLWWDLIKSFYQKHRLQSVVTADFYAHVNEKTGRDFTAFLNAYLKYPLPPLLTYKLKQRKDDLIVHYKWAVEEPGFSMPVVFENKGKQQRLEANNETWQSIRLKDCSAEDFRINTADFYIFTKKL